MAEDVSMRHHDLSPDVEATTHRIIGAAIEVHRHLGPGLLERIYEQALMAELKDRGLGVECQVEVRVPYKHHQLDPYRLDMIVERRVVVEIKAIKAIKAVEDVHKAQLLSYLRLTGLPVGLLINFNQVVLRDGVKRVINERALPTASSSLRDLRVQEGFDEC